MTLIGPADVLLNRRWERSVDGVRSWWTARTAVAAVVLACLSQGPYISLWRWVANLPLSTDSWPYVLTMWVPAAVGASWFVADVGQALAR